MFPINNSKYVWMWISVNGPIDWLILFRSWIRFCLQHELTMPCHKKVKLSDILRVNGPLYDIVSCFFSLCWLHHMTNLVDIFAIESYRLILFFGELTCTHPSFFLSFNTSLSMTDTFIFPFLISCTNYLLFRCIKVELNSD